MKDRAMKDMIITEMIIEWKKEETITDMNNQEMIEDLKFIVVAEKIMVITVEKTKVIIAEKDINLSS